MTPAADPAVDPRLVQYFRRLFVYAYRAREQAIQGVPSTWGRKALTHWDGGYDPHTGKNYPSVWEKMALACLEHQLDPAGFVRSQFAHRKDLPPPYHCHGPLALQRARQDAPTFG